MLFMVSSDLLSGLLFRAILSQANISKNKRKNVHP